VRAADTSAHSNDRNKEILPIPIIALFDLLGFAQKVI
jgi:hypothetical protein